MKKLFILCGLFALLLTNLPPDLTAGGRQEQAAETELRVALSGEPDTLDPHATAGTLTFQVTRSLYDTLVEPDQNGRIVPALAESWEIDGRQWIFRLRRGVRFHNGDPLVAADVRASLERLRESPFASDFAIIESIETPNDHTIRLQLTEIHAPLLASLASGWGAILPHRLIESGHDFARTPVGSGPFRFVEWSRGSRIALQRNPDYWIEEQPKVELLTIHIVIENAVQLQGLIGGSLDIVDIVAADDIELLRASEGVNVEPRLTSLVMVLAMNSSRPPLDQLAVRQAINHAVDKQRILDVAYGGGQPIGTFIDYADPYYVDYERLYRYDPERARELLRQADFDTQQELELVAPQNFAPHVRAAEIYQQMLADVGIAARIRLVDWPTWLADVFGNADYDLTVIGHTGRLDPDTRFGEYGYVRWSNARVDSLVAEARRVVDFAARRELYHEALGIMAREVPFVFVGTNFGYVGLRDTVVGFAIDNKLDTFDFRRTELLSQ